MLSNLKISYYAKLVKRGTMGLDDIPDEYRIAVNRFIESGNLPMGDEKSIELLEEYMRDMPHGALCLEDMAACGIPIQELKDGMTVKYEGKNAVLFRDADPMPHVNSYSVALVENTCGAFECDPTVSVVTTDDGFELTIQGKIPENFNHRGKRLLRVDLKIECGDYEDMRVTLYFVGI